ncbi:MAG: lysylphosphatidylglycerol synthase transmembrane domain-containing protein [Methanomicrobiales archaeon]
MSVMDTIRENKQMLRLILFCAGLVILGYFIAKSGILENYQILFSVNIPLYLLAISSTLAVVFFRIYRWKYLCSQYGTTISWKEASVVSVSSLFYANITPGKIGDIYKAYFMQKGHGMCLTDGISMIFYERFFELVILFFAACGIAFIQLRGITVIMLEAIAIILALLLLFYHKIDLILHTVKRLSGQIPALKRISFDLQIRKMPFSKIVGVLVITIFSLGFDFLQIWIVALAFGYLLNPILLTIFFSLSILAGLVSQIPLGVGVTEGSLSYFLTFMGVASTDSIAIVLSSRLISMYFVMVLGFIFSKFASDRLIEGPA